MSLIDFISTPAGGITLVVILVSLLILIAIAVHFENYLSFFTSTGGGAFITAVVTGIFGTLISGIISQSQIVREFNNSLYKARQELVIKRFDLYLANQEEIAEKVLTEISLFKKSIDDVEAMLGSRFQERSQIEQFKDRYNNLQTRFGEQVGVLQGSLALSFALEENQSDVQNSWNDLVEEVDEYADCVAPLVGEKLNALQDCIDDISNSSNREGFLQLMSCIYTATILSCLGLA